jgi:hypothetical protein
LFSACLALYFQNIFYLAERTQLQLPQRRGLSGTLQEIAKKIVAKYNFTWKMFIFARKELYYEY